jgi:flagellin
MSTINTNVSSILARNALVSNERTMSTSMERLSTGVRINSAKDDAAGLAIASKMTSQIRGLNQAVRNANDAISLIQTAEGALVQTSNMLQRMRELAVQSASDTNVSDDRTALNQEFQQLKAEINRTGNNTQWNGGNILDKSFAGTTTGTYSFQVGANATQNISITIGNYRTTGTANGTVQVATTTGGGASAAQVSTIVLGGVYAVGDVISAQIGDKSYNYTVTEANVVTGSPSDAVKLDRIGVSLAALINGNRPTGMTAAAGADTAAETITITGTADTAQVPVAASASGLLGGINASVITNQSTSNAAIAALDTAIAVVNTGRSEMGAVMNRLQYASDNLSTISANATESRGRILDTDYAKETTELARTQIIAQAGTAMLAQANQMKQTVLSLLK